MPPRRAATPNSSSAETLPRPRAARVAKVPEVGGATEERSPLASDPPVRPAGFCCEHARVDTPADRKGRLACNRGSTLHVAPRRNGASTSALTRGRRPPNGFTQRQKPARLVVSHRSTPAGFCHW